jgi:hypothetical protein
MKELGKIECEKKEKTKCEEKEKNATCVDACIIGIP